MAGDDRDLSKRAAELRQEIAAMNTLLDGYASKTELQKAFDSERTKTNRLIAEKGRLRFWIVLTIACAGLLVASIAAIGVITNRHTADQRYNDRINSLITVCESDNTTVDRINKGNDAKVSIVASVAGIQAEIDNLLGPLIASSNPQTEAAKQQLEEFQQHYLEGKAQVGKDLDAANQAIAAAHAEHRDCSRAEILKLANDGG